MPDWETSSPACSRPESADEKLRMLGRAAAGETPQPLRGIDAVAPCGVCRYQPAGAAAGNTREQRSCSPAALGRAFCSGPLGDESAAPSKSTAAAEGGRATQTWILREPVFSAPQRLRGERVFPDKITQRRNSYPHG